MKSLLWVWLFCLVTGNAVAGQPIKTFTSGSYAQIVQQYQGQALVMVLWSLDCPPCYQELAMLAQQRKHHAFNLVLISVDGADASNEVKAVLAKYQLQNLDAWLFEEYAAQHLRYEIDPLWYGELPRSYIFNSIHQRQAVSGVLSQDQLLDSQTVTR